MRRTTVFVLAVSFLCWTTTVFAQSRSASPVVITVQRGDINLYGRRAEIAVEFQNQTPITLRVVFLSLEYDTVVGSPVVFTTPDDFELLIESEQTRSERLTFLTDSAEGAIIDWPRPRTIDVAIGADVAAITEVAGQVGDDPEEILAILQAVDQLVRAMRSARNRHGEAVNRLPDPMAWFDWEAVSGLRPNLEIELCAHLGERISRERRARSRVEAYQLVANTLLSNNLYPDCLPRDVRLQAARAMIEIDQAQDVLVLTPRDENGEVEEQWRDIYVAGRLALASDTADLRTSRQFWPGLESLNEVKRLDPQNRRLEDVANRLLSAAADHIERLLQNENELEAVQLVGLMRSEWAEHPQVQAASRNMANGLLRYANRSLARDNLVGANNAYVMGLEHLQGLPEWQAIASQIQQARRDYFITKAQRDIEEGRLDAAEEALEDANDMSALDPLTYQRFFNTILQARWAELEALIEEDRFEDAMSMAKELETRASSPEVFGESRARTYLDIAQGIWDKYGILSGVSGRTRINMAEEALELGRGADPERADSLKTQLFIARWIFPGAILLCIVVGALVMIGRANWRKRLKANRLWRQGLKMAGRGRLSAAVAVLEKAYNLTAFDDAAPMRLGEESRGHMILRIASIHQERDRDDQVELWRGEWLTLGELERPFSPHFDEALIHYLSEQEPMVPAAPQQDTQKPDEGLQPAEEIEESREGDEQEPSEP